MVTYYITVNFPVPYGVPRKSPAFILVKTNLPLVMKKRFLPRVHFYMITVITNTVHMIQD